MRLHPEIESRKNNYLPITYSTVGVSNFKIETRSTNLDKRIVEGYGNMWNVKNEHKEKFIKGTWTRSIRENGPSSDANFKIKYTDNHGRALGLMDELKEDDTGLYFRTKPLDQIDSADDHLTQLRSGTINNFSNGFRINWDKVEWDDSENCLIIKDARLFEIAGAYFPSDMSTFAMRACCDTDEELMELTEDFIQDLPKNKQLQCRKLIAQHISIAASRNTEETHKDRIKRGVDLEYLFKNLNF